MLKIAVATEDILSEVVALRLLAELNGKLIPELLLRRGGSGYLKTNIRKWCQLSHTLPVLVLTDLDNTDHPKTLINSWMGKNNHPENLVIHVAVKEIESWLLADHVAIKKLLGAPKTPKDPDSLADPKLYLLNMATKAPRRIRDELVRPHQGGAKQGLGYNSLLTSFVNESWNPERAAQQSPSLAKARLRLLHLSNRLAT